VFYGAGGVRWRDGSTREFKLEAVRLIKDRGVSYARASEDLGVHPTQLRDWVKQLADDPQHAFPGKGQMKPEQLEIAQLRREFVAKHRRLCAAEWLCEALDVWRDGFYAWLTRRRSQRGRSDADVRAKVCASLTQRVTRRISFFDICAHKNML
jgi:transposase-like protein